MPITIKGQSSVAGATSIGLPSGIASGDLILLFIGSYSGQPTLPTGWTRARPDISGTGTYTDWSSIFYKISNGTDSNTTVTPPNVQSYSGMHAVVISGHNPTTPFGDNSYVVSTSNRTAIDTGILSVTSPVRMFYFWSTMNVTATKSTWSEPTLGQAPLTLINSASQSTYHGSALYVAPNILSSTTVSGSNLTFGQSGVMTGSMIAIREGNQGPNAPINLTATNSPVVNGQSPTFSWTFSDPDAGDVQSKYVIRWRKKD